MNHVYIKDLSKHVGEEVTLKGWLYNLRSSGKLLFPQLRDGTGIVQAAFAQWQNGKQELVWPKEFATAPLAYPAPPFAKR